jgi:hypothetical protein
MSKRDVALGHAVVFLHDGRVYAGAVEVADRYVRCCGRRRVCHGDSLSYRAAGEWCWPWPRVREVRWLRDEREQLAA